MKNKILAGVVAAVLAVTMLGTVSFAKDYALATPSADVTAQDTITVLAFASKTDAATAPNSTGSNILAVMQESAAPQTLKVMGGDLLKNNDYIIVLYGGSKGAQQKVVLPVSELHVYDTAEIDGTTYTYVSYASFTEAIPAGKTLNAIGITFDSTNADAVAQTLLTDGLDIDGEGEVEFGAIVMGVDPNEVAGKITAKKVVTLVDTVSE